MRKVKLCFTLLAMACNVVACIPPSDASTPVISDTHQLFATSALSSPTALSTKTVSNTNPRPTPTLISTVAIPTSSLIEGWLVYQNPTYRYEFSYPIGTTLKISSVDGFPGEVPAGLTFEEYLLQLQNQLGDLCVIATYREGFVLIQAPNAWDYVRCGGFGVGADVVIEKSEQVSINGKIYPARGWELYKQEGDNTILYSEFFFVDIEDGTHFAYGSNLENAPEKFDDYLAVKEILLRMLASYRTIE